ncbi:MAG: 50S ribosomal protein L27 [Berkelbacteria bacterium GW2011_GWB1_38_5]|uniref:Large ribosomal subunit protein bL27 n=2 Tax=Candidatus Berkelbacteria TaxID=1618330 RepID=A0A0G0IRN2_9BACT|nr:MAG: 50S ribosomal protein L27 [Berkelbacteria bacterium GW2011_GWA1_36_9]KKQ72306.1 MAG: 50S ribosomal protein L27 [Berkelbacteria bacterium GW2011_GWB1_38_5]
MAHTKAKGTSKLGRDSISKRLGVKVFGSQKINAGQIIIRQRGSKFYTGEGTAMGKDDTLYAKKEGTLIFTKSRVRRFSGRKVDKTIISVK